MPKDQPKKTEHPETQRFNLMKIAITLGKPMVSVSHGTLARLQREISRVQGKDGCGGDWEKTGPGCWQNKSHGV